MEAMMKNLRSKVIVITGAASGIGRALAVHLATEGAILVLADKDSSGLEETQQLCDGATAIKLLPLDVTNLEDMNTAADDVVASFGGIDVLINNAGVASSGHIGELTFETLRWTIEINLWGVINGTKAFLPHLMARPEANLVNISSVYGLLGVPGQAAYCTSKFAVRGFTEAVRQDLRGTGVAVTVVFPGGVRTQIVKNSRTDCTFSLEERERLNRRSEELPKTLPEDAAEAIVQGIRHNAPRVLIGSDARKIDLLARLMPGGYDVVVARYVAKFRAAGRRLER